MTYECSCDFDPPTVFRRKLLTARRGCRRMTLRSPTRTELHRWLCAEQDHEEFMARILPNAGLREAGERAAGRARMLRAAAEIVDPVRALEGRR